MSHLKELFRGMHFIISITEKMKNIIILCPRISSIHILLNESVFINTPEFRQCSFKSMNIFQDFNEMPPLANQVSMCEVFQVISELGKDVNISLYYKSL